MDTYFAPARRTERRKLKNQIASISENPIMDTLLSAAQGLMIVLNQDRQIVAINHAFLDALGVTDIEAVLGFRMGETLNCKHADSPPSGCGTTEACISCGAAIATMTAIVEDRPDEKICALLTDKNGEVENICLLIQAKPVNIDGNRWILVYARDVTKEHFWQNLERVFFHDLNNILTALYGNIQLLEADYPDNQEAASVKLGIERLMQEISMQRALSEHRQEGVHIHRVITPVQQIEKQVRLIVGQHRTAKDKSINQNWPQSPIHLNTDPLLVSRVLGNMLINACEASAPDDIIKFNTTIHDNGIRFDVWNKGQIDPHIQTRVFQKHFSTKAGGGRGLGTYSMKLLGEKYLGGQVFFKTDPEKGTTFSFRLPL